MNIPPSRPPLAERKETPPLSDELKKKNVRVAVILLGMSLFMFVSFIVKTALKGP